MKIATWNVNGIRARRNDVVAFAEREQPDVLCLQELKALPDQIPEPLTLLADYWSYWHGMKGYSGVSLHVSKRLSFDRPSFSHPDFDHQTRIVVADVSVPGAGLVSVASVYVPNGGRDFAGKMAFLRAMAAYAAGARTVGRRLIVCGDINIARTENDVHPSERDDRVVGQRPQERALFEQILDGGRLHDVSRELDPTNDRLFTWWAPWRNLRQRNVGWRLDYVLASASLAERATSSASLREVGTSDHAPVVVTFDESGA